MAYVEVLQAEHVLEVMRLLGWQVGTKPTPYAALQAKCREKFQNGGDGGRIKKLRGDAITLAMLEDGIIELESADISPSGLLPEEFQSAIEGLANDMTSRLHVFDRVIKKLLDRYDSDAKTTANSETNKIRKESELQTAAFDEEITEALLALESNNLIITDLNSKLTAALTAAAHAEGRACALSEQLEAKDRKIKELEHELKAVKGNSRVPKDKQPAKSTIAKAKSTVSTQVAAKKSDDPASIEGKSGGKSALLKVVSTGGGEE